jgi:hypothetical protein
LFQLDYDGEAELGIPVENCYYQGTVNGDPSTFVAISTCNGLWGLISFQNGTTLGIWPLDGGDRGRRHPHVLYQTKWTRDGICGAITQITSHSQSFNVPVCFTSFFGLYLTIFLIIQQIPTTKDKREVVRHRHTRFMKLAIIGDHEFVFFYLLFLLLSI